MNTSLQGLHPDRADSEEASRIAAAVKLLFAATIRGFWVVEERETVFGTREFKPTRLASKAPREEPRIAYIPRIKYLHQPDLKRCAQELSHAERRAHFVAAHLRRTEHASSDQLVLATWYGFQVPTGYTFVRPHERGHLKREVIYRSRLVNWIVQCKCYALKHKVGPDRVRELEGVLEHYPSGTRGMIVTTSTFTSGAVEEGQRAGIRLVEGEEFVRLLTQTRKQTLSGSEPAIRGGSTEDGNM